MILVVVRGMTMNARWWLANCEEKNRYICQRSLKKYPAKKPAPCVDGWELFGNKCYQSFGGTNPEKWMTRMWRTGMVKFSKNFDDAQKFCKDNGGSLASIADKATHEFLINLGPYAKNTEDHTVLGGKVADKKLTWLDGTEVSDYVKEQLHKHDR